MQIYIKTARFLHRQHKKSKPTRGVEIYEAVIDNGIKDFEELKEWVKKRRMKDPYFWTPKE